LGKSGRRKRGANHEVSKVECHAPQSYRPAARLHEGH
jgi:hypothetical protein